MNTLNEDQSIGASPPLRFDWRPFSYIISWLLFNGAVVYVEDPTHDIHITASMTSIPAHIIEGLSPRVLRRCCVVKSVYYDQLWGACQIPTLSHNAATSYRQQPKE